MKQIFTLICLLLVAAAASVPASTDTAPAKEEKKKKEESEDESDDDMGFGMKKPFYLKLFLKEAQISMIILACISY